MKSFLLITTALVTLGAAPVFAAGSKPMRTAQVPAATMEAKPPASQPGGCPHNQPTCGGLVQTQDGKLVRPSRVQQDAREAPVTQSLNMQAQQAAGVGTPAGAQFGSAPPQQMQQMAPGQQQMAPRQQMPAQQMAPGQRPPAQQMPAPRY
jgi:hypothetical protein